MNIVRQTFIFILFAAICALLSSCRSVPDTNDPQIVAEMYLQALLANDYEKALAYVWVEEREHFREQISRMGLPPGFPQNGQVEIFIKKKGNGHMAGANFLGGKEGQYGADMRFINGRWWITKQ